MNALRLVLVVGIAFSAAAARADDTQTYLYETKAMVRQGKYEEALKRYVWFHENAQRQWATGPAHLSYALNDWKELSDVYPAAKTAMIQMRDTETQRFYAERDVKLFAGVAALNRVLEEEDKTLTLFQWADKAQPAAAKRCWPYTKQVVLRTKQYQLAGKYIGNPVREFESLKEVFEMFAPRNAANDELLVEQCLQLIELSLAMDEPKAAKEIQEKALAIVDDQRLHKAIPTPEAAQK